MMKMTKTQATQILGDYNAWRRGRKDVQMPSPTDIGCAIDFAVKFMTEKQKKAAKNG